MNSQNKSPGTAGTVAEGRWQGSSSHSNDTRPPIEKLRQSMSGFRKNGRDQYIACCTAHEDKNPSVSIRELPDGRVLMFCHAGCETVDVLAGAGLSMSDLFPDHGRYNGRPVSPGARWDYRALIRALRFETTLINICANDLANNRPLSESDRQRLIQAAQRVNRVAEVAE